MMQSRARRPVAALTLLAHSTLLFRAQLMVLSALVLALISGVVIADETVEYFATCILTKRPQYLCRTYVPNLS